MLKLFSTEINIQTCVQDSIKFFCNTPKSATYRQHARPQAKVPKQDGRPNLSYYSRDYNEQPSNELVCFIFFISVKIGVL